MVKINASDYQIELGNLVQSSFSNLLKERYSHSKVVIMVDENTHDNCLEYLLTNFEELKEAEVMLLPNGEENKVMEVCFQVFEALSEYQIGRNLHSAPIRLACAAPRSFQNSMRSALS